MLESGVRIGPYEIIAAIGAGGMGEVYRARDARIRRDVALKVLPRASASDPERIRRFEQEAMAALRSAGVSRPSGRPASVVGSSRMSSARKVRLHAAAQRSRRLPRRR